MKQRERIERLLGARESRAVPVSDFELRSDVDELVLEGYASVFDAAYEMYGGPDAGGWLETVDRRAFDRTLNAKPDVHLLVNHEGMPLARTKSGTLDLVADRKGLKVSARLDRRDPDVQSLAVKMGRGDMDEMSFAFRTVRHEWNEDETTRRLLELNIDKGDVSVVNFGANPATSSTLRGVPAALSLLADIEPEMALAELRSLSMPIETLSAAHAVLATLLRTIRPERRISVATADPRSY